MGSDVVRAVQHHCKRVIQAVPLAIASQARRLVGEELKFFSLIAPFLAGLLVYATVNRLFCSRKKLPPQVPGLPIIGNLLQLREKKPHKTFTRWIGKYGPIYSIKTGLVRNVVINSPELAKEAMVTKFSSISTREMPSALQILTRDKIMVAMSDYGAEHRFLKKLLVGHLLGPVPQKRNRPLREATLNEMLDKMVKDVVSSPDKTAKLNVREYIVRALFPFSMYQVFGRDPESVYVPELSKTFNRSGLYNVLVLDPLKLVTNVDWRDFFPFVKAFISNNEAIDPVKEAEMRKSAVIRALIEEQRQLLAKKQAPDCFLDILLTDEQARGLTPVQLEQSTWEPVIESSDTTPVTIEWLMYELCLNQKAQDNVYEELKRIAENRLVTEDDLPKLVYLQACIKETLRKYPPVPIIPLRHIHEDVQLGGYDIPKGWQLIVNLYGINNDPKLWPDPEKWDPERMLHDDKLDLGFTDFRVLPFGAGKRMCAGVQQAMPIIALQVASFLQHFSWKPAPEEMTGKVEEATIFLTTHKLHPLKVIATARPCISKRLSSSNG